MNIEKIKNGNNNLTMLQLISTKMNKINKSKSESKHKDLNNIKYLNYKILLQEKDNNILKLKNEIDYYKDCININLRKKNNSINNDRKKVNILKIIRNNNQYDIFKQKCDSMRTKKIKLIQKNKRNFTLDINEFKTNNDLMIEKNSYSKSLSENKSNLINFSINNSINTNINNEYFNLQKSKMDYLQKRMNNLMNNLFGILESNKGQKK